MSSVKVSLRSAQLSRIQCAYLASCYKVGGDTEIKKKDIIVLLHLTGISVIHDCIYRLLYKYTNTG
jgi:hypothetical protein